MKGNPTEIEMREALGLSSVKRARTRDFAMPDRTTVEMSVRRDGGVPFRMSTTVYTAFRTEAILNAKAGLTEAGLEFWCLLDVRAEQ